MRTPALAAVLVCALLAPSAQAVKMMYTCTSPGGAVHIQDQPCDGSAASRSYATPSAPAGHAGAAPHPRPAAPSHVDFSVACRSLTEERGEVVDAIRQGQEAHQQQRLQKRLARIRLAECTARCHPC
jgi:hypothetical protein